MASMIDRPVAPIFFSVAFSVAFSVVFLVVEVKDVSRNGSVSIKPIRSYWKIGLCHFDRYQGCLPGHLRNRISISDTRLARTLSIRSADFHSWHYSISDFADHALIMLKNLVREGHWFSGGFVDGHQGLFGSKFFAEFYGELFNACRLFSCMVVFFSDVGFQVE